MREESKYILTYAQIEADLFVAKAIKGTRYRNLDCYKCEKVTTCGQDHGGKCF